MVGVVLVVATLEVPGTKATAVPPEVADVAEVELPLPALAELPELAAAEPFPVTAVDEPPLVEKVELELALLPLLVVWNQV